MIILFVFNSIYSTNSVLKISKNSTHIPTLDVSVCQAQCILGLGAAYCRIPPLISWTDKTHHTQPAGCKASRTVKVFVVTWDQLHLDRTQRVLRAWTPRGPVAAKTEAAVVRQAIAEADRDTVEPQGGLDVVVDKIDQLKPETVVSSVQEMMDDFRLWGAYRCRRMDAPLRIEGWHVEVARELDNPNASLSEGKALAVVVKDFSETPH